MENQRRTLQGMTTVQCWPPSTHERRKLFREETAEGFKSDLHDIFPVHSRCHCILPCDTVPALLQVSIKIVTIERRTCIPRNFRGKGPRRVFFIYERYYVLLLRII